MQHAAAQAYSRTAQTTASPRELEIQLLLKAAAKLQAVKDGTVTGRAEVIGALRYNRKLWSVFAGSLARPENPLPLAVKRNVASLAVFVLNHTLKLEVTPAAERLGVLININREIAAGLAGRA